MLLKKMRSSGDAADLVVKVANTKGLIHYERRLHQLLLREEEAQWKRLTTLAATYEQEIAEQHALQERRWAGTGIGTQSAGASTGPGSGPAATLQRTGTGGRSQPKPSLPALPSPGARAAPNLTPATLPSTKQGSSAASCATAGAAANVAVAAESPMTGSPDGSAHGGACCSIGPLDAPAGPAGSTSVSSSNIAVVDASGSSNGQANGSAACMGTSTVTSVASGAAVVTALVANGGGLGESRAPSPTNALPPAATLAAPPSPSPPVAPPASSAQKPEVLIQHSKQRDYWMVSIRCRDRQKLLFDTVCTLADLNYDVYHGAVDCELEDKANVSIAVQTFYMRPRYGDSFWDPRKAAKLKYMLECAIQRRQPQGTKVHIQGAPCSSAAGVGSSAPAADLPALTAVWRKFGLCITRAKVRALAGSAGEHTFYLVDNYGRPPADTVVQQACQQIGGVRLARPGAGRPAQGSNVAPPGARGEAMKFAFTVLTRPGWSANQGSPANSLPDSI
ncbi:hypothetical protein Vretimale_13963 [Volvox reticuliferus]|nr:hypothetical protein Vretimale_13963 [Volvox reticuliferus]